MTHILDTLIKNPSLPVLFIFLIYYGVSMLLITCLLFFVSSIRMKNIMHALSGGSLLSVLLSSLFMLVLSLFYSSSVLYESLVFCLFNLILQGVLLWRWYGVPVPLFAIPLIVGNSLAYWMVFPTTLQLF